MSKVMTGLEVANAMKENLMVRIVKLKEQGILPQLVIVRVGERPDDLSYERGAKKRMEALGIETNVLELPESISQELFEKEFAKINEDPHVHGILVFRPLPKHLNEETIQMLIDPQKDVDCMSPINLAKVFSGDESGYAPCTAEAVMKMLHYYQIDPEGKKVTIAGRSMVVGKPLAMLLLKDNATVKICHTKTVDFDAECQDAEILVAAVGKAKIIKESMVGEGTVVVDVGINVDEDGNLCGDVDYASVEEKTSYISPVPRGVGSITTSVLAEHVVRAAEARNLCE